MYDFLNITFQGVTSFAAVFAVVVAILVNRNSFRNSINYRIFDRIKKEKSKVRNFSRRRFIILFGASIVGGATWSLLQIGTIKNGVKRFLYTFFSEGKNLIINSKSGIIHHREICKEHLPIPSNITNNLNLIIKSNFHSTKKLQILDRITDGISAEDAIEILMVSAEHSPTSVHIYDKLVKLLGKLKRYESIHFLLENAENKLKDEMFKHSFGTKAFKKYKKAISHIQLQKTKVAQRAKISALNLGP